MNIRHWIQRITSVEIVLTTMSLSRGVAACTFPSAMMQMTLGKCHSRTASTLTSTQLDRSCTKKRAAKLSPQLHYRHDNYPSIRRNTKTRQQYRYTCYCYPSFDLNCPNSSNKLVNRYERLRRVLSRTTLLQQQLESENSINHHEQAANLLHVGKTALEVMSSNRRTFHRSWKRMKPMLELILESCRPVASQDSKGGKVVSTNIRLTSIADVGCDHGFLALCCACMSWVVTQRQYPYSTAAEESTSEVHYNGMNNTVPPEDFLFFTKVVGTDVSSLALENGGIVSHRILMDTINGDTSFLNVDNRDKRPLPIEFRVGYGLDPLQPGEADAIVLAGMGHHTMLDILFGNNVLPDRNVQYRTTDHAHLSPMDRLQSQRIFLQPTNSRPQHMMELYDRIHASRQWDLKGETIAHVGGRYYINSFFERKTMNGIDGRCPSEDTTSNHYYFPGYYLQQNLTRDKVLESSSNMDHTIYESYVNHHRQWLENDSQRPKYKLEEEDRRWLEYISPSGTELRRTGKKKLD